jgi:hypothetical protein
MDSDMRSFGSVVIMVQDLIWASGFPRVPQPGEREWLAVVHVDEVGCFCFAGRAGFPFIKSIGQDQAAFMFEAAAKGWFSASVRRVH